MIKRLALVTLAALGVAMVASATAHAAPNTGFGFNAPDIRGFLLGGAASLTGGGAFDATTTPRFVHSSGGFSCLEPVQQGLLSGCQTGQGVRWDTEEVLTNTMFKCTGAASEAAKPATTNAHTVVLRADFYRAGDANEESFTAQIIALTTTSPQI